MSAELGAVVIFDEVLYKPGGQVHRWMTLLCKHFEEHAKHEAPVRTGGLKAGITSEAHPVGIRQMNGTIASNAPYSLYVLKGTKSPIRTHRGWANPSGAYRQGTIYKNPLTGRWTQRAIPGVVGVQVSVPQPGYFMAFGPDAWGPRVIAFEVRGQASNNFLIKAWRATAKTHPSIRGLSPSAEIVF